MYLNGQELSTILVVLFILSLSEDWVLLVLLVFRVLSWIFRINLLFNLLSIFWEWLLWWYWLVSLCGLVLKIRQIYSNWGLYPKQCCWVWCIIILSTSFLWFWEYRLSIFFYSWNYVIDISINYGLVQIYW